MSSETRRSKILVATGLKRTWSHDRVQFLDHLLEENTAVFPSTVRCDCDVLSESKL